MTVHCVDCRVLDHGEPFALRELGWTPDRDLRGRLVWVCPVCAEVVQEAMRQ
jgi:hypothetical protein